MSKDSTPPQLHRMPWYPSSFYATTRTWPFIARAIYRELLDVQWDAGGLPAAQDALRALVGVTAKEWRTAWSFIRPKFQLSDDGLLRNARLEAHRADALMLHAKRKDGAAKTNAKRRGGTVVPLRPEGDSA